MRSENLNINLGVGKSEVFSELYYELSKSIVEKGSAVESRYGRTTELLNFKTIVGNPRARCTAGYYRDINIFFLLAEALWIWTGRKDVKFLQMFNSRMKEFSDDGMVFHAPYGFRLRHYGVSSLDKGSEESKHHLDGYDQLKLAINLLHKNPEDRRVVMSIWNPDLDLGTVSKDLPCNDMVMFKIRDGKLFQTISNRSNDVHWGLPTNVFQFSFIGEVIASILGLDLGDQVHNSQSLHAYYSNDLTYKVYDNVLKGRGMFDLYLMVEPTKMDFQFDKDNVDGKLIMVDDMFNGIINSLTNGGSVNIQSKYFTVVAALLGIYIKYSSSSRDVESKLSALENILKLKREFPGMCEDYMVMAMNFFASRLPNSDQAILNNIFNSSILNKSIGQL